MSITQYHTKASHWQPYQVKLIDDKWVSFRDVVVHTIRMGDVEDPDLFVARPIYEWQESDAGKFVMEHAVEKPYWHRTNDVASYGHRLWPDSANKTNVSGGSNGVDSSDGIREC